MVNGFILVAIQWNLVRHGVLYVWLGALMCITAVRSLLIWQFHCRNKRLERVAVWKRLIMGGILFSGLTWGMAGILLFPSGSDAHQMFTVFTIGGMVAGASATYSAFPVAFLLFGLPAMLPVIAGSFAFQDGIHVAMAVMTSLFLMLMIGTCYRNYRVTLASMRLKFEKQDLVEYLSQANEQAASINRKLKTEIDMRQQIESELERHQAELASAVESRTAELRERNRELQTEIRERGRIAAALQDSEERYRCLVENSIVGIYLVQDKTIIFANNFMSEITGLANDKIVGTSFIEFVHQEDREQVVANYTRRLNGEMPQLSYPIRIVDVDGEVHWLEISAILMSYGGRPTVLVFCRDVTQQRKLEAQLFQSEKMASIGQLAAGVAHEINNPVGFVNSNLHSLKEYHRDIQNLIERYREIFSDIRHLPLSDSQTRMSEKIGAMEQFEADIDLDFLLEDWQQLIQESQDGTNRIKNIVCDLKSFAHPGEQERQAADINQCIESTLNIVWNELKYKVTVIKDFGQLPELECYPQQLNQVFMNLLVNAGQAIADKGEIRILTRSVNSHIEIEFSDTGCGIPEANLGKIFDPFFTTKAVGKGTGLGLHVSYNIIKKHHGNISVNSKVGQGTTFSIQLPV